MKISETETIIGTTPVPQNLVRRLSPADVDAPQFDDITLRVAAIE